MPEKRTPRETPDDKQPNRDATSPLARNILTALAVIGALLLLWVVAQIKAVVVLVLISVVLATGLAPAVAWVEHRRIRGDWRLPRPVAIFSIYLLALFLLLGAITAVAVPVITESIGFSQDLPEYIDKAQVWLEDIRDRYPQIPDYAGLVQRAQSQLGNAGQYIISSAGAVLGFFGGIISAITVIVLTYYMLSGYETIKQGFLSLIPAQHRKKAENTLGGMAQAMGGWLRGQLLLAGIIGAASTLAMFLLGVPYPFLIGVVGAVGELVPMLGPFAAAIPAVFIAIFGPTWKLVAAVLFFAILAQIEGNYLAPKIMQKQVGLSPLVTLIALLIGASLLGVVGALLAVPLAAGLQVLYVDVIAPAIRSWGEKKSRSTSKG